MIYEDIFSVPINKNSYKSYIMQSHVRAKFRCRIGVGQYHIQFVQYKKHYAYGESP